MPRSSAGTYTLPEAPFTPNTPISSAAVNNDLSDAADALTDSLSRTGQGGMQTALPLNVDGFFYTGDSDTGMRRSAANIQVIKSGGVDTVRITALGIDVLGTIFQNGVRLIPPGVVWPFAGASAPTGFVLCDGGAYSRATYAVLFSVIGTAYGPGDGSTTFNVPDLRGRLPAGMDGGTGRLTSATMTPDGNTLNASGGTQTHTLSLGQTPVGITSTGSLSGGTASVTSTNYVPSNPSDNTSLSVAAGGGNMGGIPAAGGFSNSHIASTGSVTGTTSVTSNNTGGAAHLNVQPTLVMNYIIFTGVA